jgi:hypothetical protein
MTATNSAIFWCEKIIAASSSSQALHSVAYLGLQFDLVPLAKVSGLCLPVFFSFFNLHLNRDPKHPSGCEFECTVCSLNKLAFDEIWMSTQCPTSRQRGKSKCLSRVWNLTLDLSNLRYPAVSYVTTGIALWIQH